MSTDKIVKQIQLNATPDRVWKALTNGDDFGAWFGMKIEDEIVLGARVKAQISPTKMDDEVAALQKPYLGMDASFSVEKLEFQRLFVMKSLNPDFPTTASFAIEAKDGGTLLTITEAGFEKFPADKRQAQIEGNTEGWNMQEKLLKKFLAQK